MDTKVENAVRLIKLLKPVQTSATCWHNITHAGNIVGIVLAEGVQTITTCWAMLLAMTPQGSLSLIFRCV